MWMAHECAPKNFTGVDVTDPKKPRVVVQTDLPHRNVRSNSLEVCDNIMAVAYQTGTHGATPAGIELFDISTPEQPRSISFIDRSGPRSRGVHQLWFIDGKTIHCSSGAADFMPRNLMMPADAAEPRLGVLDFQDAVHGPITYDIACLMRDAFVSWDEEFVLDITVRYWQKALKSGLPVDRDFGEFYRAVEWMGLQRHLKVAGIFARLTLRDGKPKYLADTPRFIAYIRATCARYRELTPLLRLIDEVEGTQLQAGFSFGRL